MGEMDRPPPGREVLNRHSGGSGGTPACLQAQRNIKEKFHMSAETSPTVTCINHKPIRHVEVET